MADFLSGQLPVFSKAWEPLGPQHSQVWLEVEKGGITRGWHLGSLWTGPGY